MKIGQSIRKIRKARKINQSDFCRQIGIAQAYLSQIETGVKTPTISVLNRISSEFGIPLPVIFWYGMDSSDIKEEKRDYFAFIKPTIDSLLEAII